jgi:pimeloyl-ACP methyl ester carboxylesterase
MGTLNDIVIIIPSITGSVLERDGQEVWNSTVGAGFAAVMSRGETLRSLELKGEDSGEDTYGDGVVATRLVPNLHILPGIGKIIDGYDGLRALVQNTFDNIIVGDQRAVGPANYFEFAYDWRRDNKFSAQALKRLIDKALPAWRENQGVSDAKVIILAHSMGGLVARYWLEELEGWPDCRALISFGTPYRGAPNAAGTLINGYKKLFVDATEAMRSFPSIYQLLPTYPMVVNKDGAWKRIAECELPSIDQARAKAALKFHDAIKDKVAAHQGDARYLTPETSYRILPVVGVSMPTAQSLTLENEAYTLSSDIYPAYDRADAATLPAGDGTVPRLSATPLELSNHFAETFVAARHASLQANGRVLDNLRQQLVQMQARGLSEFRGPKQDFARVHDACLSLAVDDAYMPDEPVRFRAELRVIGDCSLLSPDLAASAPSAQITSVSSLGDVATRPFIRDGEGWRLDVENLPAGTYRLEVGLPDGLAGGGSVPSVLDVFEVADPRDL